MGNRILMTIRVTAAERAQLRKLAKAAGFRDVAGYIRDRTGLPPLAKGRPAARPAPKPRKRRPPAA